MKQLIVDVGKRALVIRSPITHLDSDARVGGHSADAIHIVLALVVFIADVSANFIQWSNCALLQAYRTFLQYFE